jgi:hypothetical protein
LTSLRAFRRNDRTPRGTATRSPVDGFTLCEHVCSGAGHKVFESTGGRVAKSLVPE